MKSMINLYKHRWTINKTNSALKIRGFLVASCRILWFSYGITKALWAGEEVVHGLGIGGCSLHHGWSWRPSRHEQQTQAVQKAWVVVLTWWENHGKP